MLIRTRTRGITLIELLVGLAVLAILLTAGLPSYSAWIQNLRVRAAAESIVSGLQLARSEAVKGNHDVAFVLGTGSDWSVVVVNPPATVQSRSSAQGSIGVQATPTPAGATTVTFNSLGRTVPDAGALAAMVVDVPPEVLPPALSRRLRITVSPGGQVRMCDPAVTEAADPRFCGA